MPQYEWTQAEPFRDHANDRVVAEGEVVDLPEHVAEPQRGFVSVEDETPEPEPESDEPDYENMEYSELRQRAVDADTDEINGRSSKDEIIAYFSE